MSGNAGGGKLSPRLEALEAENARLRGLVEGLRGEVQALHRSTSWRVTAPLRGLMRLLRRPGREGKAGLRVGLDEVGYAAWILRDAAARATEAPALRRAALTLDAPPLALLMPVRDADEAAIATSMASLRAQICGEWRLCIVDAGSRAPHVARVLAGLTDDARVKLRRCTDPGTAAALRLALASASGDPVGLIWPGEMLAPEAVVAFRLRFARDPELAIAFADEDRLDEAGRRRAPRFKGGWSPDLLLASPGAVGRPWFMRQGVIEAAGGFRDGFEGAEEYDLLLRAGHGLPDARVAHLPGILAHLPPSAPPPAEPAAAAALEAARREDPGATLDALPGPAHRLRWSRRPALVSVIIPTRDRAELLAAAAAAVLGEPGPPLELLVVDNGSREPETATLLAELARDSRVRVLAIPGVFNWAALNNAAAAQARGDLLLLLNNDVALIQPGWLDALAAEASRESVGAAGALLLYGDDTVQHAGVWLGPAGHAPHLLRGADAAEPGYLDQLRHSRNLMAVTGACLAIRRQVFNAVGGLDTRLRVAFNDVDLCLRVRRAGYRVVWTPHASLRHLESASRGDPTQGPRRDEEQREAALLREIWGDALLNDPYFNPYLDRVGQGLGLIHPRRAS